MVVLARAVAARIEARDHGAAIVRRAPPSLLRRASGIEARLVHRPAVALVAIVLRLRIALTVARIQVHVRAAPAGHKASATRVASGRVHRAGAREPSMHGRVVGLRTGGCEMRPGEVPGSGVVAAAQIPAGEVATAHGVPAARDLAPAPEGAPPPRVASPPGGISAPR